MTITTEAKTWIKSQAKEHKINPVGKSIEKLLELIAEKLGEKTEVVLYMAEHGGKIQEVPGFQGIKPMPNRKENSAGGKVEPEQPKPKKSPRKVAKQAKEEPKAKAAKDDNLVSLSSILEEMGVEGRIARRKLRGSDIAKPAGSWEWPKGHSDIQRVKDLLKK